jgi:hypothetical protein
MSIRFEMANRVDSSLREIMMNTMEQKVQEQEEGAVG